MPSKRRSAPPAPRVRRMSTSWPPADFSIDATLVQPACVKCRRPSFKVRHINRRRSEYVSQNDYASVCNECWDAVLAYMGQNRVNLKASFWAAKPVEPTGDVVLVNLVEFEPHKCTAVVWRQFREERRRKLRIKRPTD